MKRYGSFGKNLAALLMLMALLSLLLPCCKIGAGSEVVKLSGLDMFKTGIKMGLNYTNNGYIDDTFVIKGTFMWGDLKKCFTYVKEFGQVKELIAVAVLGIMPVLLCVLSMLMTWSAIGKKTMFLPTLFIGIVVFEQVLIVTGVDTIQEMILGYASNVSGSNMQDKVFGLLIGEYLFTILCAVALLIVIVLWMTDGFDRPEKKRSSRRNSYDNREEDSDNAEEDDENRRKRRGSRRKRRDSKRRNRRDRKKRKNKRGTKKRDNRKSEKQKSQNDDENNSKQSAGAEILVGRIYGNSGIYLGMDIDISEDGKFTLGTTSEALKCIQGGNIHDLPKIANANCIIKYNSARNVYLISSHSDQDIIIRNYNSGYRLKLIKGQTRTIDSESIIFVGRDGSSVRLR